MNPTSKLRINGLFSLVCLLSLVVTSGCHAETKDELYSQKIIMPPSKDSTLLAAVKDLRVSLKAMTGTEFETVSESGTGGIDLILATSPNAPAVVLDRLTGKGMEAFFLLGDKSDRLTIAANSEAGLTHGIYYYLEKLGVHYYFPNERWTIVPHRSSIRLQANEVVEPAFKLRTFFGTGGFGDKSPVDPNQAMKARWGEWQRRNRFGGSISLDGHAGEAFNVAHKAILQEHPEYMAMVNGQYGPWSETVKLNVSNPEVVRLFIEDRLSKYRQQIKADPGGPRSFSVSVSPADGSGFCECAECKKIGEGTPSDQAFYLANQVAKAVSKEIPGGHVNMYAYAGHSALPHFALEPNVYVQIIPYAFQDTGLSPNEFIKVWGEKVRGMSLYDYWAIPDWNVDLPTFDYQTVEQEKIRYWYAHNINGFTGESTYSAGAMGLAWYVAARLMWNPKADDKAITDGFFRDCFQEAEPPMRRMLERWSAGFQLSESELALSFRDLQEANRLAAGKPDVTGRIDDYARYVQYLRLQYENTLPGGTVEEKEKSSRELLRYIWSIYDSGMVHTFRLNQFLVDYGRNLRLYKPFDLYNKEAEGWQEVKDPSHGDLVRFVDLGVQDFQPLAVNVQRYSSELKRVDTGGAAGEEYSARGVFKGRMEAQVLVPNGVDEVRFKLALEKPGRVVLKNIAGQTVAEAEAQFGDPLFKDPPLVTLPVKEPGQYTLEIAPKSGSFMIQTWNETPTAFPYFLIDQGSRLAKLYFYVPKGTRQFVLGAPAVNLVPDVLDGQGRPVAATAKQDGGKTLAFDVPDGQDGTVWTLGGVANPNAYLLLRGVPQWFSLSSDATLTPVNAGQGVR